MTMYPQEPPKPDRSFAVALACVLSSGAFIVAMIAVIASAGGGGGGAATGGASGAGASSAHLTLNEFSIDPKAVSVATGAKLHIENKGALVHNVEVKETGLKSADLKPGESGELDLASLEPGSYTLVCNVPGHTEAGMTASLVVGGGGSGGGGAGQVAAAASSSGAAAGANPNDAKIDFAAEPPPEFKPYDPTLQPAPGGTVHDIELHAGETELEVAPGVKQQMWTFDGKVPGTTLRGKVGDVFNVKLVNDGKIGHSVDFHASRVAWNDEMRTIQSGESLMYQFRADYAGAWMYHCGTSPTLHHIGNGMYGAIIIDPPDLAPVAHEYLFVQSEIYTGPQGQPGDLIKMQNDEWDAVVFNGYVSQYKHKPIRVEPNERIRVWVVDDGPSENSAFHIVGTIFDTVYKEGNYLLRPDQLRGGSQVLDLQPAQGGFTEFSFAEAGLYPFVTHKFSNVGKGAIGLFQAGEVETTTGGGH